MTTTQPPTIQALPAKVLSSEAFAPYGRFAAQPDGPPTWLASGSRVDGVREDHVNHGARIAQLWNLGDLAFDGDVPYLGFVRYFHQGFRVAQLERHPQETQTWLALTGASFVVVAPPTNDRPPQPEEVAAFLVQPGDLIAIARGAWMCHFFPLGEEGTYAVLTARREPEQDRDLIDTRETAGVVFEITLP